MTKIRANIVATGAGATPAPPMVDGDALLGLGFFGQEYLAPYAPGIPWPCPWSHLPLGWTNAGPGETTGRLIWPNGCVCEDCDGQHFANQFDQVCPGDAIDCAAIDPSAASFDHGITPQVVVPGCKTQIDDRIACDPHHPSSCQPQVSVGVLSPACWPCVPFATANPSLACRVVDDTSGPVGFENDEAMEIDFAGGGDEGATFVGSGGGKNVSRCGVDSSVTQGLALGTDVRSGTGWSLNPGDRYITLFAVKAVPDGISGFVCSGYHLKTTYGFFPNFGPITVNAGTLNIVLTGAWQAYYLDWTWAGPSYTNAPFSILTPTANAVNACGQFVAQGRIHVKNALLLPNGAGVRMRRTTYMGGGV